MSLCMVMGVHVCALIRIRRHTWTSARHKCNPYWQAHSFGPVLFEAHQTPESIGPHHKQHAQQTTPEQTQI